MRFSKIFICFLTLVLLVGIVFIGLYQSSEYIQMPFSVEVSVGDKKENITCWENKDNECYVFLPSYASLSNTKIVLKTDNKVVVNNIELCNDMSCKGFELNVQYDFEYDILGKTQKKKITFMQSSNLATMYINTASGNMDYIHSKKGNKESGTIKVYTADGFLDCNGNLESIGGRGNYSWDIYDKKPYNISLSDPADLLGMGEAKNWVLLANSADSSNLRNKIVYDFAKKVGLEYSPDSQWIDVYLNGEYAGLYLLSERNEVHFERVNINGNESFLVSMEPESRLKAQNKPYILTESLQALRVHYSTDNALVKNVLQATENAIISETGKDFNTGRYWYEIIDLNSWAKKYLIEEIFGNYDAGANSQFFYYDSSLYGAKVIAGPVWDYDISMGNESAWQLNSPDVLVADRLQVSESANTPWFYYLCRKEAFYKSVKKLYQLEISPLLIDFLNNNLNQYAATISEAYVMNSVRWQDFKVQLSEQVQNIYKYMVNRLQLFDDMWINNEEYYIVRADGGFGSNYAYYCVKAGETLTYLHDFENTKYSDFSGWYYTSTNEPFNINKPIYEDTEVYAKWNDSDNKSVDRIIKYSPIFIIAVMFIVLFAVDFKRNKGKR